MKTVVFACDASYVQHLATAICSLVLNAKEPQEIDLRIFESNWSSEQKQKLESWLSTKNTNYQIQSVDLEDVANLPTSEHFSLAIYIRLLLPRLLPDVDHCLYLDSDTVILKDVSPLFSNLKGKLLAAVEDGWGMLNTRLSIPRKAGYFNSGVLAMNLTKAREVDLTGRTLDFISRYTDRLTYFDQDVLNALYYRDWKCLHPRWNLHGFHFNRNLDPATRPVKTFDFQRRSGVARPSIVHFTGPDKPWNLKWPHLYSEEYFHYRALSAFPL